MMTISINSLDELTVDVSATGKYSPDVMHDLQNRALEAFDHAAFDAITRRAVEHATTTTETE